MSDWSGGISSEITMSAEVTSAWYRMRWQLSAFNRPPLRAKLLLMQVEETYAFAFTN